MAKNGITVRPNSIRRVGICTDPACDEQGVPIEVPDTQLTYTCSCGQVVDTFNFNFDAHRKSQEWFERDQAGEYESQTFWNYAPQLALTKDDDDGH